MLQPAGWLAQKLARTVCVAADVELSADTLRVTRRCAGVRCWKSERVRRADAGALRLVQSIVGEEWGVEVGNVRLGAGPMTRDEAEWVAAMMAAHWPELASRAERRVLGLFN